MDRLLDYEVFLQYLLVVIAANCENSSEGDKLFVNERDSECHKADEVSEGRLMGEIGDELDEVGYNVCEVAEAYKRR